MKDMHLEMYNKMNVYVGLLILREQNQHSGTN